jgi:hypothetical protein
VVVSIACERSRSRRLVGRRIGDAAIRRFAISRQTVEQGHSCRTVVRQEAG